MRKRYQQLKALAAPSLRLRPGFALREAFRQGYGKHELRADLMAGAVVGVVALPLSMALAVASGVAPQYGLYTAIVGGFAIALLGGSRVQVSGPTAAFVVILAPISATYGIGGLLIATMMAGCLLLAMGLARLGRLIEFIPYPVTAGFTAGIAVVIGTMQLRDFFGLTVAHMPEHYLERLWALLLAMPTVRIADTIIGALTLAALILWPRYTKKVPAPLVALAGATLLAFSLESLTGISVVTIQDRFEGGIPQMPPVPVAPWTLPDAAGNPMGLSWAMVRELAPSAFAIAMLGGIESLLSAVVADGMKGTKHDPDVELMAQGIGNLLSPIFGGIAATGAIARTATNVRSGAISPIAAVVHALVVLAAVLALAPLLGWLPMASLAALLLIVAWNMSEAPHFIHTVRVAPKSDVTVLLSCFLLTVLFDMVVSVTAGILVAALLFMRRMAEVSNVRLVELNTALTDAKPMPSGVLAYEVAGPLFFGAAHKAMTVLGQIQKGVKVVLLDLRPVPAMDATGLVNLESAMGRLKSASVFVVIAGIQDQPLEVIRRAEWKEEPGVFAICRSYDEGVELARVHATGRASAAPDLAEAAPGPSSPTSPLN